MCPTNSHFKKENYQGTAEAWPLNNWQELIDRIINKTDLDIVITRYLLNEKKFIDKLNLDNARIRNLCGITSLPNLVEVMKKSVCTIANDSGSVHVAGATSKKVIALHGPTPFPRDRAVWERQKYNNRGLNKYGVFTMLQNRRY